MKKLIWCLCLAILLGMATGCQTENLDSVQTTDGFQNTDIRPLPPEDPGNSLIEYDPDRQLYIGAQNIYMDYYAGITGAPYLDIPVYSKSSLGTDKYGGLGHITVELFWDQFMVLHLGEQYSYHITQVEVQRKTEFMAGKNDAPESVMPYYLYQAYRGEGAYALADARANYVLRDGMTDPLRSDFEALTEEDLPEFYVYNIRIRFLDMPEPDAGAPWVLERLKLTVNGESYEAEFGGVRFLNRADCPDPKKVRIVPQYADTYTGCFSELYSDGVVKVLRIPIIHKLDSDINYADICDVWALDEGSEVLAAYVTVKDQYGEYQTFAVNDLENRRTVQPVQSAYVDVVVKNEHADKLLSNIHFQIVVWWGAHLGEEMLFDELVAKTEFLCEVYTVISTTNTNHYENYAIIFDGVDMEPYYDYYFENYETWRKDYVY